MCINLSSAEFLIALWQNLVCCRIHSCLTIRCCHRNGHNKSIKNKRIKKATKSLLLTKQGEGCGNGCHCIGYPRNANVMCFYSDVPPLLFRHNCSDTICCIFSYWLIYNYPSYCSIWTGPTPILEMPGLVYLFFLSFFFLFVFLSFFFKRSCIFI